MSSRALACSLLIPLVVAGCPARRAPGREDQGRPPAARPALKISDVSFAGPAGHREPPVFGRGERLLCLLSVARYTHRAGKVDLVVDLTVRGQDRQTYLRRREMKLLRGPAPTARPGEIRAGARLQLDPAAPPGRYTVKLEVHDRHGGRRGSGSGRFELAGRQLPAAAKLALLQLRPVADRAMPAGSVLPLAVTVAGFASRSTSGGRHRVDVSVDAALLDSRGRRVARQRAQRLQRTLPFAPRSYPLEYRLALPAGLPEGRYRAQLRARDALAGATATASTPLDVRAARSLSIYNLHLHDESKLARQRFMLGERAYVRLAVQGFRRRGNSARLDVDLAVAGPGGVYLARKGAASIAGTRAAPFAAAGRYPLQLPLELPRLARAGIYRLVLRARDRLQRPARTTVRELRFELTGASPPPLSSFKIDRLVVRRRGDLPPLPGDTFVAGQSYLVTVRAAPGKLAAQGARGTDFPLRVSGGLRLRTTRGVVVDEHEGIFQLKRNFHHRPLRIVVSAEWRPPPSLPRGLYDLEIELLRTPGERVSQLRKRVEVLER